jgi:hypothetical protein
MPIENSEERRIRRIERAYQLVYAHLEPSELIKHEHSWPEKKGVLEKSPDTSDTLFLDYYGVEGVRLALESYGFLDEIRRKNLGGPKISIHRHEKGYDIVRVHTEKTEFPIVELVAQTGPLDAQSAKLVPEAKDHKFLHVRWLRMQNPLKKVKPDRPLLPGQDFVGLGLGREMMVLLQMVCNRLQLDGIVELPERLHNAALYFQRFRFFDPEMQGILTAILRDTQKHSLVELAWGMEIGALVHKETRKTYRWIAKEQVLPRAGPILLYLNSQEYRDQAKAVMEANHFSLQTGDLALDQIMAEGKEASSYGDLFPSKVK